MNISSAQVFIELYLNQGEHKNFIVSRFLLSCPNCWGKWHECTGALLWQVPWGPHPHSLLQDRGTQSPSCWEVGWWLTDEPFLGHCPQPKGAVSHKVMLPTGAAHTQDQSTQPGSLLQYRTYLSGHPSFQGPHRIGWGLCGNCSAVQFVPLLVLLFLLHPKWSSWQHPSINLDRQITISESVSREPIWLPQ